MAERAKAAIFFQSMLDIFDSLPCSKRCIVLEQLTAFGKCADFVEFLSAKMDSNLLSDAAATTIIDLADEYVVHTTETLDTAGVTAYIAFLLKVLVFKANPSSQERHIAFLKKSFEIVQAYDVEALYASIASLPFESSVIPITIFAGVHKEYEDRAFKVLFASVDLLFNKHNGTNWVLAFSALVMSSERRGLDDELVMSSIGRAVSDKGVSVSKKVKVMESVMTCFSGTLARAIVDSHYLSVIHEVDSQMTVEDIAEAIRLALSVFKLVEVKPSSALDADKVIGSVFGHLASLYRPAKVIHEALIAFSAVIPEGKLGGVVEAAVKSGNHSTCTLFLISKHPSSATLPYLFSKRPEGEAQAQYSCVFDFLSHQVVPVKFFPRLLEILQPVDLHFLNGILKEKPVLYCAAAVQLLSICTSIEKMEKIAELLCGRQFVPLVASQHCQAAFAMCAALRVYSKRGPRTIRALLDYLNQCVRYAATMKIEQTQQKLSDDDVIMLSDKEIDEMKKGSDTKMFDMAEAQERSSATGFCQAQVIRDWCQGSAELTQAYVDLALKKIQNGEIVYAMILASLSSDQTLIHNCVETLRDDAYLLVFFLSACACCEPNIALVELRSYIVRAPAQPSASFMGRILSPSRAPKDVLVDRQKIGLRVILSSAPFVPCRQACIDSLVASIPDQSSALVCETVVAICDRMSSREVLQGLLDKMLGQHAIHQAPLFAEALALIISKSANLSQGQITRICHVWVQLLLTDKIPDLSEFEKALFDPFWKGVAVTQYMKEMEKAIVVNSGCVSLFMSLKRVIALKVFDAATLQRLSTSFITNCLSNSKAVSDFCVAILKQIHELRTNLVPTGRSFSLEYAASVKPFLDELASKFTVGNATILFRSLLERFTTCDRDSWSSIVFVSTALVARDPKAFVKAKQKFMQLIVTACSKIKRATDYPVMLQLFRVMDMMAKADTALFYKEFLLVEDNEFSVVYLRRFVRSAIFADGIALSLLKQLQDLVSFTGKKNTGFVVFPRLILMLKYHVKYFVTESVQEERMASILFGVLMLLSSINNMRQHSQPYEELLQGIRRIADVFSENTGIDLGNGHLIDVSTDDRYCQTLANLVSFMDLMSPSLTEIFVQKLTSLDRTNHAATAVSVVSSLLSIFSACGGSSNTPLIEKILALYLLLLKQNTVPDTILSDSIARASPSFTFHALLEFNAGNFEKLLNVTLESTMHAAKAAVGKCIDVLLNIMRAGSAVFLEKHADRIIKVMQGVVGSGAKSISAIPVLNVIGELTKKVPKPVWFIKEEPISFYSLAPLLVDSVQGVSQRAMGIFTVLIFGHTTGSDQRLLFTSLMSIFFGVEENARPYVAVAMHLLKALESKEVSSTDLELIGDVMQPMLAVNDSVCNTGLQDFLKFLRRQATSSDSEIATKAMMLMTRFASPRQVFVRKQ